MDKILEMFTIYRLEPEIERFGVLRLMVHPGGEVTRDKQYLALSWDLDSLRRMCMERGLVMLARDPSDAPEIVETWI
jgi:hypothetical protein